MFKYSPRCRSCKHCKTIFVGDSVQYLCKKKNEPVNPNSTACRMYKPANKRITELIVSGC